MFGIRNATRYDATAVIQTDADGRDVVVAVAKGTFRLGKGGRLELAEPLPLVYADEYTDEPGASSIAAGTDFGLFKPRTDVIVAGSAFAPGGKAVAQMTVELRAGALSAALEVTGDRTWKKGVLGPGISSPEPFREMPLVWERAFGGTCEAEGKTPGARCEENPVGAGLWTRDKDAVDQALPNLEDPAQPVRGWKDRPAPACWGFVAPAWEPRRSLAGTYDAKWERSRLPLLPEDFDHACFQQAPAALQSAKYFVGGEQVRLKGLHPKGELAFELPKDTVEVALLLPGDRVTKHVAVLDTVVLRPAEEVVTLTWRVRIPAPDPITSVLLVQIDSRTNPAPVPAEGEAIAGGARG